LRNVSSTKVVSTGLSASTPQNWWFFEDRATMIFLTPVLGLKAAVPVNTWFRQQKVARESGSAANLGYCTRVTYSNRASIECLDLEECSTMIVAVR
jgi:hypothetical protein